MAELITPAQHTVVRGPRAKDSRSNPGNFGLFTAVWKRTSQPAWNVLILWSLKFKSNVRQRRYKINAYDAFIQWQCHAWTVHQSRWLKSRCREVEILSSTCSCGMQSNFLDYRAVECLFLGLLWLCRLLNPVYLTMGCYICWFWF